MRVIIRSAALRNFTLAIGYKPTESELKEKCDGDFRNCRRYMAIIEYLEALNSSEE